MQTRKTPQLNARNAWLYVLSAAFSMLGNSFAEIVIVWLILDATGNPAAAGTVVTFISIPSIAFALAGGHLIDRFGRKPMSIISDIISGLSIIALLIVYTTSELNLGWFITLGILGAIGDVPGMAARSALVGEVAATSSKTMDWITGTYQSLSGVAMLIGPALGGILLATLPPGSVLWIVAACSFLAAALTALIALGETQNTSTTAEKVHDVDAVEGGWWAHAVTELRSWLAVLRINELRLFVLMTASSMLLVMPYLIVLVPAHFHRINDSTMYGITMSAFAIGLMGGGLLVAKIGTAYRRRTWFIIVALETVAYLGMIFLANQWLLITAFIAAGIGGALAGPLETIIVTEKVPLERRGRAFSLFETINLIGQPIGIAIVTVLVSHYSIYAVAVMLCLAWIPLAIYFFAAGNRFFVRYAGVDTQEP